MADIELSILGLSIFDDEEPDSSDGTAIIDPAVIILSAEKVASFRDVLSQKTPQIVRRMYRSSDVNRQSPGSTIECDNEGPDWGKR